MRHKRIDTGLSRLPEESPPVKISISPTRREPKAAFEIKKTTKNHFTGKSLASEGKQEVEIEIDNQDRDPSLYVQVGEQKCVFKYGERPDPEPRLIESVISYVQKEDEKGQ